ncbi:hypothetical protein [Pseudoxanthomonas sp. Root630]|uniref:hypothetical protein n=1 Tax=Pseudoxanthomonas sp. Root630 TaxID=1736574 RepID=UPI0007026BDA|nr:hypothetical protein [Pseudoxanthomonas sp. Root630]KRA48769.1 hypothetical protein ASD72_19615 [Pseudoxanthomonas sp. Root630]
MIPSSTTRPYVKQLVWLVAMVALLVLSLYTLVTTLDADPSPGPFFIITSFALFLVVIRAAVRVVLVLRGHPKN